MEVEVKKSLIDYISSLIQRSLVNISGLDISDQKVSGSKFSFIGEINKDEDSELWSMNSKKDKTSHQDSLAFLSGGGEMGERIRTFDWANTPLGPVSGWSPALHTMLSIMLANRFPHILWWGPHYIQFYNDPYRPVLGAKHPDKALGLPANECWAEIWNVIGPLIDRPFNGGPATWDDDIYLEINRHGFVEESHFTIAYSPVPDETVPGGIGGVLATVHEITGKVVGDRRVLVLRDAQSAEARTAEDACTIAAKTLANHSKDIPFALLYLIDPDRKQAHLTGSAGVAEGSLASPSVIPLEGNDANNTLWPLEQVMRSESIRVVKDLPDRLGDQVPPGTLDGPAAYGGGDPHSLQQGALSGRVHGGRYQRPPSIRPTLSGLPGVDIIPDRHRNRKREGI